MGILLIGFAPIFPILYNTTDTVRSLATYLIIIFAAVMPFHALAHASYFTLRSGGQVLITILFDSVFMWVVAIPTARLLADLTKIGIKLLFPICHGLEAIKAFLGLALVSRKTWVKQLVSQSDKQEKKVK
jgi:Na+-driven multidrug efflux pump